MKKSVFLSALLAAVLAGCSSVPLNDVPVEDKQPVAAGPATPGGGGAASTVTPVQADPAAGTQQGPQNVSRLVYFDFDSYTIKPEFQSLIDAHARFLKSNPQRHVVIEGHTDERGGREYNLALGQRRSEAVRRALGLLGVADRQMEAVSFGKEKPAMEGSNEEAWARNRRAEITYR
jgi:peptidoglycan-associated lipoprotein